MITDLVKEKIPLMPGLSLILKWAKEKLDGEQPLTVLIAFVAEEFKFDLEDYREFNLNKLNNHIINIGKEQETIVTTEVEEPVLEITTVGIVSILQSWVEFYYEGVSIITEKVTILRINGQNYDTWKYTDSEVRTLSDDLCVLLSAKTKKKASARAKVGAIYEIFKSPRMNNEIKGYGVLLAAVADMQDYSDVPPLEQTKLKEGYCEFIIAKYLEYLWTMNAEKKDTKFILSFENFIHRHKDAWARGLGNAEESLNLYIEEHNGIVETFRSLREPAELYRCQRKENHYNEDSPRETMQLGLDGT